MARPKNMKDGRPVKLYLPSALIVAGSKAAFVENDSLSGLVRRLLEKEVEKNKAGAAKVRKAA
jgi:hypothetical protein